MRTNSERQICHAPCFKSARKPSNKMTMAYLGIPFAARDAAALRLRQSSSQLVRAAMQVCASGKVLRSIGFNTKTAKAVSAEREVIEPAYQRTTPSCSVASVALGTWSRRGLTPRSTGAPTAGHQRPAGGTRYIFTVRALASCRRRPVTSNVRPRLATSASHLHTARQGWLRRGNSRQ